MRKSIFVHMLISLCLLFPLVGCMGEDAHFETEPILSLATLAPTRTHSLPTPTETPTATAEPEPVSTPTPEPSATATTIPTTPMATMPVLLQANTAVAPIVCNQFKSYINIQQETNNESWELMDYVFENENAITFLMWSNRPYPGGTPTPFAGTIEPGGVPPGESSMSKRRLLKGQIWDFNNGTLVESPVTTQGAMNNPCDQDCPLEVVGVAPDNSWQLLQITDAPADYQGLWLVNNESAINLIPYVPSSSQWQWSSDSQMLWLVYTLHDNSGETYGSESMVVDLTMPASPQIIFRSWEETGYQWQSPPNLLSPDEYTLVFSPVDKTVLLYEHMGSFSLTPPDNPLDVYIMDVTQNPPQLLDTYKAHYPFLIDWSDTLQDFVILELSTTGAVIYTLNNDVVYEIPMGVLKNINLDYGRRVAISPAQKNIVLMTSTNAWAYSCSD